MDRARLAIIESEKMLYGLAVPYPIKVLFTWTEVEYREVVGVVIVT
jgi:hypothetical protein